MNLPRGGEGIVISAGGDDQLTQSQQYYHQSSRNPVVSAPKDPSTKKRDQETTKTKVVSLGNCNERFLISIRSQVRLSVGWLVISSLTGFMNSSIIHGRRIIGLLGLGGPFTYILW